MLFRPISRLISIPSLTYFYKKYVRQVWMTIKIICFENGSQSCIKFCIAALYIFTSPAIYFENGQSCNRLCIAALYTPHSSITTKSYFFTSLKLDRFTAKKNSKSNPKVMKPVGP